MDIGIIGIGLMGRAFVERFLSTGYTVRIYNRSPDKIKDLGKQSTAQSPEQQNLIICHTVAELLQDSEIIILMLSDAQAIRDLLQLEQPAAPSQNVQQHNCNKLKNKTLLQMATISAQQSKELESFIEQQGGQYLEAPVLGSVPEANTGSLIIMAAGNRTLFEQLEPTLQVLGKTPRYIGKTGSAAALKLAMNQLIASLTAGFSLSLGYAIKNDVNIELFMDVVRDSALYAPTFDKKLAKYLSRDFGSANFSTRHLLKDIRLFIEDAKTHGLNTDALEAIERITHSSVDKGQALLDYSSIFETICPDK